MEGKYILFYYIFSFKREGHKKNTEEYKDHKKEEKGNGRNIFN